LDNGLLVEVEAEEGAPHRIAASGAKKFSVALDQAEDLLRKAVAPLTAVWGELNRDMSIERAEISLALGFEAEGNLFLAKGTGSANITFKLTVRPTDST
jgi:hypothetical protein